MCYYWKVTRSLVSYDVTSYIIICCSVIERSPDHWWVTTTAAAIYPTASTNWKVTRSLVSYDIYSFNRAAPTTRLKGHQIIGELRHLKLKSSFSFCWLKGHQIIGELRLLKACLSSLERTLKGHQIIGELRREWLFNCHDNLIERSPDHWWVTTPTVGVGNVVVVLKGHQIIGELRLHARIVG